MKYVENIGKKIAVTNREIDEEKQTKEERSCCRILASAEKVGLERRIEERNRLQARELSIYTDGFHACPPLLPDIT